MNVNTAVNRGAALVVATLSSFLTPFMSSSITIALPSIGNEFAVDAVLLSWVVTAYLLTGATFLIPVGRAADIYGSKRIFKLGILTYTSSSLLLGVSTSITFMISFRILQGIGVAMIFSTGMAILTSIYPVGERGKALGINIAAVYLGLSLGPCIGGFLTQHFGWRSIFLVTLLPCSIIIAFAFWKLKGEWAEAKGEKFDFTGSLIYGLTATTIMYGFSLLPRIQGASLIFAGVLGIFVFVKWEMKAESPILDMNLFKRNTVFTLSNIAALISYSATFAVSFLLSLYLQYVKGFSPQNAGLILVFQPFVQAIFSPFTGRLSDRIEPRLVASAGMVFTVAGLCFLIFLNEETGLKTIIASLMLLGFGFALFSSPNMNAILSSVEKRLYGVASATLATTRLMGQTLSMGITVMMFAIFIGRVQITPEHSPLFLKSLRVTFIIFATLCFLGIGASFARGRVREPVVPFPGR